ncbi:MAG TPA: MotA/TolQ/ExbB proton channel family protein [Prolixibacteraceae bacterium]|jgi:biopolymer transport protein ExbB|nr:MotA/TolQ/ExbB proton channel family protein [Prolixibacteraceae bacterium]HPR85180.1 MotA/TolQ/ExbB proton channel family protein [Prolixibacteraceae bacterium]
MLNSILLQVGTNLAEAAKPVSQTNPSGGLMKELIQSAIKSELVMIPLLVLTIVALFIFFERYIAIYRAGRINSKLMKNLREHIRDGKIESAFFLCQKENTPTARMIEKGMTRIGRSLADITTAIEHVGNHEISRLERRLPILASVVGAAPMIGVLGTVIGIIQAFYEMASSGATIDLTLIFSNIYQTLVTTVAGFVVGLIAYFAYNILVASVKSAISNLKSVSIEFMDILNEQPIAQ